MKRLFGGLSIALLLAVSLAVWAGDPEHDTSAQESRQTVLPLSAVVLYSSGVGYFQRDGSVDGRGHLELRFKVDNINDLLKSMVVQDFGGGRVATVTYDSRDPVTKTLKSFAVDLTTHPSLGEFLGQIRGESIEVATPNPVRGVILGVEKKREQMGDKEIVEVEYLNLLAQDGLRSLPLNQLQRIQLTNERLDAELRQALTVLASSHDTQKKTVALEFDGEGRRRVRIGYIIETPVWKTSYRLVLAEKERPFLQGWAIVENTTDEDWQNVHLSLVSGRPISFTMDMYEPLYVQRPAVVPELYASLKPQTYGEAMEASESKSAAALSSMSGAFTSERMVAKSLRGSSNEGASLGVGAGAVLGTPAQQLAELRLQQGVISVAQATELGEVFQYTINTPVSLARQKSALLPIVNEEIGGTKLSIYNERVHAKHPLNGFRLKNSTPLHLMQGPITVFDGGTYAGDARIEDLPPGQERLISYAIDLKMEVEPLAKPGQQQLVSVSIRKGTLFTTHKAIEEKIYNVENRDQKKKEVLIEHPFRADWQLVEPSKPAERSREVYRFAVTVDAGQHAQLRVREEKPLQQAVQLMDSGSDLIASYVQAEEVGPQVKEALQKVVALRDRLNQTTAQRSRLEQRINEITQEQARIRENMARLAQNSELYNRYVSKLDQQETEVEKLRQEIEVLKTTEDAQRRELNDYLLGLDIS